MRTQAHALSLVTNQRHDTARFISWLAWCGAHPILLTHAVAAAAIRTLVDVHLFVLYLLSMEPVLDLKALAGRVQKLWHPTRIARLNDYEFKLARMHGDFVWHAHEDTDEAFMVVEGELRIDFRDGSVRLKPGQLYVVPRGVEHKPFAGVECTVLLIEPLGTLNTGNVITDKTVYHPDRLV